MIERFSDEERLKILIAALERYQANYNTSAYSTMGFWLVGLGWLLTSSSARSFIETQPYLKVASIVFIWLNWVLFSYASYRVYKVSNKLYDRLVNWKYAEGAFEHAKMPLASIALYSVFIGLVVVLITVVLYGNLAIETVKA
ncbi:hypothetical protein OPW19_07160 [Vibrio europaeus]|uniref:hypothetical protein n=1 Tax=Vibrio europaeus TaxID=300876 RepID=UPI00233F40A0|nr:hypothetical protein [Vibrio europaeus]MDC5819608.1 hypothetical protein [Vibrio europaeus]MDC5871804.1 hypothetical protein [Vibrio europaeus]